MLKSIDYWAACEECKQLVDAEDIEGLLNHAVAEFEKKLDHVFRNKEELRKHLRRTYELFMQHRIRVSGM